MSKKPAPNEAPEAPIISLAPFDLVEAIAEIQNVAPNKVLKTNQFTSKYISLDVILDNVKPILAKHNLALYQHPISESRVVGVATKIIHTSGHIFDFGSLSISSVRQGRDKEGNPIDVQLTAQEVGSAISYIRRISICIALSLAVDTDDDGAAASRTPAAAPAARKAVAAGITLDDADAPKALAYCRRKGWLTADQTIAELAPDKVEAINAQFPAFLAAIRKEVVS